MEITIEKLIYGGEGLAHHDGSTVFVPFVLPAERVRGTPVEQKKKFVRARVGKALQAFAGARDAALPALRRLRRLRLPAHSLRGAAQIQKRNSARDAAAARAIEWPGEIAAHASPPWGYRNRAQWKIRPLERRRGSTANGGRNSESAIFARIRRLSARWRIARFFRRCF